MAVLGAGLLLGTMADTAFAHRRGGFYFSSPGISFGYGRGGWGGWGRGYYGGYRNYYRPYYGYNYYRPYYGHHYYRPYYGYGYYW
jgi:hypothetical protein